MKLLRYAILFYAACACAQAGYVTINQVGDEHYYAPGDTIQIETGWAIDPNVSPNWYSGVQAIVQYDHTRLYLLYTTCYSDETWPTCNVTMYDPDLVRITRTGGPRQDCGTSGYIEFLVWPSAELGFATINFCEDVTCAQLLWSDWVWRPAGRVIDYAGTVVVTPRGDCNCDGSLNSLDIDALAAALVSPAYYDQEHPTCNRMLADCNQDGSVNSLDIDPFVQIVVDAGDRAEIERTFRLATICWPGDCNYDGAVNVLDIEPFIEALASGDVCADCNGDGAINGLDVDSFVTLLEKRNG